MSTRHSEYIVNMLALRRPIGGLAAICRRAMRTAALQSGNGQRRSRTPGPASTDAEMYPRQQSLQNMCRQPVDRMLDSRNSSKHTPHLACAHAVVHQVSLLRTEVLAPRRAAAAQQNAASGRVYVRSCAECTADR